MNKRAQLVQAIRTASTLTEQARHVRALDDFDRQQRTAVAEQNSWDAAGAVVEQTLTPVRVHEHHTAATDWIGDVDTSGVNYHQEVVAQASAWYGRVSEAVKADPQELAEQARGMARRTAGKYGENYQAAAQTFLDYIVFLNKSAASGLPQIDQLRDPKDDPSPTPLPTEVFDTFEAPIHPVNQGVSGTEDSYRAPLIQEIEQAGGGSGAPERADQHSVAEDETDSYSEVPEGEPGRIPTNATRHAAVRDEPSLAIGYTMNLNDWQRQQAEASRLDFKQAASMYYHGTNADLDGHEHLPAGAYLAESPEEAGQYGRNVYEVRGSAHTSGDEALGLNPMRIVRKVTKKEAASQLPQVQQEVDSFENPAPTALPTDVMFPLVPGFGGQGDDTPGPEEPETKAQAKRREYVAALLAKSPKSWSTVERAEVVDYLSTTAGVKKVADQFTAPHEVPGGETPIANSADTTPVPPTGSRAKGFADGQADRAAGERPTFSDASSGASEYVQGYSEGYADGGPTEATNPDVPYSMGGDSGQAQNFADAERDAQVAKASARTANRGIAGQTARMFGHMDAMEGKDPHHKEDYAFGARAHGQYLRGWNETRGAQNVALRQSPVDKADYAEMTGRPDLYQHYLSAHQMSREGAHKMLARDYSQDERQEMADKGQARSDGSFPIKDKTDLDNAKHDVGRSSDPAAARRWINERAKDLGEPGVGEDEKRESSLQVSAAFVTEGAEKNPDFKKGYAWATRWTPKIAMVRCGSPEFEAGVYAGITDNPKQQKAWVIAHRRAAKKHKAPELMRRISLHEKVTRTFARKHDDAIIKGFYVQAATSVDLITDGPGTSPDPMGATPINGPGTPPPMGGGVDPARPGGASPYNGAPPYGTGPVAPDPVVGDQQPETPMNSDDFGPGYSNTDAYKGDPRQRQIAFRQHVQASLDQMKESA